jgi:hypothetical protein
VGPRLRSAAELLAYVPRAVRGERLRWTREHRYLLYVDQNSTGVIEAKPVGTTLSGVEWQSAMCVRHGDPLHQRLRTRAAPTSEAGKESAATIGES